MAGHDSDDAMEVMLAAAAALPDLHGGDSAADDSDDAMRFMVEAAGAPYREQYRQRGTMLCQMMRNVKKAKANSRCAAIAPHVQARVDRHNEHDAIRSNDLINVNEKGCGKRAEGHIGIGYRPPSNGCVGASGAA